VAADIAPYARSEKAMAAQWLPCWLDPDMLVLADRGFYSFKLWRIACGRRASRRRYSVSATAAKCSIADMNRPHDHYMNSILARRH
jgi:hypothetical protein